MLHEIVLICRHYPQILIFLSLALGYFFGKIRIRGFSFGSSTGVLISALVLGQIGVDIPELVQEIGFSLCIFCMGYQAGPQFFGTLNRETFYYILLALFVALVGLATTLLLGHFLGFGLGMTAGLLSGAMTQSTVIGTARDAIDNLSLSTVQNAVFSSNITIAYTITYVFGTIGLLPFFKVLPRILGIDLKKEAKALEEEMFSYSVDDEKNVELFAWNKRLGLRAYRVTNPDLFGKTVLDVELMFPEEVAIDKIRREGLVFDPASDTVIEEDDVVALVGDRKEFLTAHYVIGPEVDDERVVDITGEVLDICVIKPAAVGKTLAEISDKHGHGCFLRKIIRHGHELPLARNIVVKKCDILRVAGAEKDVERLVDYLGFPERSTAVTDLVTVGLGCALGILVGLLSITVWGVSITLGIGGGVLVMGLLFGWLRSLHPTFGQIPAAAQWIFNDFGLNLFIACVGLSAAPLAVKAFEAEGLQLFLAGIGVTLIPVILGLLFGKFILKLHPVLLLGALAGAATHPAAFQMLKEDFKSTVFVLGYTIPSAFSTVILTIWGTIIVNLMV